MINRKSHKNLTRNARKEGINAQREVRFKYPDMQTISNFKIYNFITTNTRSILYNRQHDPEPTKPN